MIEFEKFQLENGLRVIVHEDHTTPLAVMNILYDVGARDEHPERTGFAHLFEHLMFGGSVNIPDYDRVLERVGGINNAFTTNDLTNYYLTLPANNLETAFWLESDRMLGLAFSKKSLDVQRNVVIEEFRQRYLNQPYGDIWLLMRPLAYKVHPYRWATIGKDISHIENAVMKDVRDFFHTYYRPNNAIMVVAGNVKREQVERECEKWFSPILRGDVPTRNLPVEPKQKEHRTLEVKRDVPLDSILKVYHICARKDKMNRPTDLLSDVLSNGNSSRLYRRLVKEKKLFSEIHASVSGDLDEGLFIVSGRLIKGVKMNVAENAIKCELAEVSDKLIGTDELEKVKNKIESLIIFSETNILNRAMSLAFYELLGNASLINEEIEKYRAVKPQDIRHVAENIFCEENCSTIYYYADS